MYTLPDSSRAAVAIASARTTVPRWICQKHWPSSCGNSSRSAVRIRYWRAAVTTRTYLSADSKYSTSATGTMWIAAPTLAWITPSRCGRRTRCGREARCGEQLAQLRQRGIECGRSGHRTRRRRAARLQRGLQPRAGLREAIGLHRLQHVVDRGALEGLQRVLVVGGDEHEQRQRRALGPV